jgi:hypothetical protein
MAIKESDLNYFLQRNIVFVLENKIIKEGKLFLYNEKDYYLIFYMRSGNNDQKKFEIPYPFSVERKNNYLILDYSLSAISGGDSELYYRLVSLNQNSNSRFYNNKIIVFEKNTLDFSVVS